MGVWFCDSVTFSTTSVEKSKINIRGYFGCVKPDGVGSGDTMLEENQDTVIIKILKKDVYSLN